MKGGSGMEAHLLDAEGSYQAIIDKYKDTVYRVAYSYCKNTSDADDIFQEVFLRYFKNKPKFNTYEHEKAWFIRVTINCCKKLLGSFWFRRTVALQESIQFEDERESEIFHAIMELPLKYRTVVHLYYYEDYSIREISEIIDIKETTIQTQLQRARNMLRKKLKEEWNNG